jgi:glycerate dehydrogenase
MKIIVLDGYAMNPGDLSWNWLEKYGTFMVFDRTEARQAVERIGNADAVLVNKVPITEDVMSSCPDLRYIGVNATGYNVVDIAGAHKRGITVTNVPGYSTSAVAQQVFAFILSFSNRIKEHSDSVFAGDWLTCPDFTYWKTPLCELEDKTLGIFGFGAIGKKTAVIAQAFGMRVLCHTRRKEAAQEIPGVLYCTKEELFAQSDFISLHCPLTDETKHLINNKIIALMKKTAVLINTARGALIDEEALQKALVKGQIAGFAADVISEEPMKQNNPLLRAPNTLLTPHIAWASLETRKRLMNIVENNLKLFLSGNPQNVV